MRTPKFIAFLSLAITAASPAATTTSSETGTEVAEVRIRDTRQPNILVLWGDDVGITNISANSHGMMGYRTPNIDRVAAEGMRFTDYYAEQSCTAGRASFILGQSVFRSGLSKVGLPGAELGSSPKRIRPWRVCSRIRATRPASSARTTSATRIEHLPTAHGFDEFMGNLYHLNAEEEPENEDYPARHGSSVNDKHLRRIAFGPRGVIHSRMRRPTGRTEDGGHRPAHQEADGDHRRRDAVQRALEWIREQHAAGKPWFCWWNGTRMHFRTHVKDELRGISGQDEYSDGMVEHDMHIGHLPGSPGRTRDRRRHASSCTRPTTART